MNGVIKDMMRSTRLASKSETCSVDENLIRAYLRPSHAKQTANFHVRRTLDQYAYAVGETSARDKDQLVYRRSAPEHERIFMVDELWLWILDES